MKLQKMIEEASKAYYTTGQELMTDAEFDNALDKLKKEDPDNPILSSIGHGIRPDMVSEEKFNHKYGLAVSLSKCHDWKEYQLKGSKDVYASLKLDGLSIILYYEKGHLTQALTRFNGVVGLDKTDKVKIMEPSYSTIDPEFTGAVRGEILMSYESFEKYQQLKPEAKHPRNSAAGIVNSKFTPDEEFKFLNIVVYTVIGCETAQDRLLSYEDMNKWLAENFANTVQCEHVQISESNLATKMDELRNKWYGTYPSDGIVLTDNAIIHDGHEVKYNACAYKYLAETCTTEVEQVEWNLSKTKFLIPRVNIRTVNLSGANISWTSGFNAQFIKQSQLGKGAVVEIMRSNEVIPDIQKIVSPGQVSLPENCPCCNSPLEWKGVHLWCPNMECGDAKMQDLLVWSSFVSPVDGLGDTLKVKFFNQYHVKSIDDVYVRGPISEVVNSAQQETFIKMFNGLFTNSVSIENAIQALNIPRLGQVTSHKLSSYRDIIDGMIYSLDNPPESFKRTIGSANYDAMCEHKDKFHRLQYIKSNIVYNSSDSGADCKPVVITGKLSVKRSVFEGELAARGYAASDVVSKNTFALITDDKDGTSSKNLKANKLNIPKFTESEFRKQFMS